MQSNEAAQNRPESDPIQSNTTRKQADFIEPFSETPSTFHVNRQQHRVKSALKKKKPLAISLIAASSIRRKPTKDDRN